MVRIRLSKVGRHHTPLFRVVACNQRSPRDGKALEILGTYDPKQADFDKKFQIDAERVKHWIRNGAQPTVNIWNLLRKKGINKANFRDTSTVAAS